MVDNTNDIASEKDLERLEKALDFSNTMTYIFYEFCCFKWQNRDNST